MLLPINSSSLRLPIKSPHASGFKCLRSLSRKGDGCRPVKAESWSNTHEPGLAIFDHIGFVLFCLFVLFVCLFVLGGLFYFVLRQCPTMNNLEWSQTRAPQTSASPSAGITAVHHNPGPDFISKPFSACVRVCVCARTQCSVHRWKLEALETSSLLPRESGGYQTQVTVLTENMFTHHPIAPAL